MSQGNYGGGYTPPNPPNPYADPGSFGQVQQPKKSKAWMWILGIVGAIGILGCGCCGVFGYMGYGAVEKQLSSMLQQQIQNDPVIQEHIGPVESVSWEVFEVDGLQKSHPDIHGQMQAFKVKGPKGEGIVFGAQVGNPTPSSVLESPILKKDGKEYPLSQ